MTEDQLQALRQTVRDLLVQLGDDPDRDGLRDTPDRVARSWQFFMRGYEMTVDDVFGNAIFNEACDEMVIVKDIELYSLCEHHLLPFVGRAHIAYIPRGRIVGLSKVPRLVEMYARRLQVQERLTTQIANTLNEAIDPLGVAVVIQANHLCMMMRGVEKQNSNAITSCMLGAFKSSDKTRAEFLNLVLQARIGWGS